MLTPCPCFLFAACRAHAWRRFERAAMLPLTRAPLQHAAWPVILQRKGAGYAPTKSGAMGIMLASASADRNCAALVAAARIIHAAAKDVAKQRAGHPKRLANLALLGYGFLFWRRCWTTSSGPTRRS